MTVDGGSLLYGLGEDDNGRLTVLAPLELAGAPERVATTPVIVSPSLRMFDRFRSLLADAHRRERDAATRQIVESRPALYVRRGA